MIQDCISRDLHYCGNPGNSVSGRGKAAKKAQFCALLTSFPLSQYFIFYRTPNSDTPGADADDRMSAPHNAPGTVLYNCGKNTRVLHQPCPPDIFGGMGQGGVRTPPVRIMNPIRLIDMRMSAKRILLSLALFYQCADFMAGRKWAVCASENDENGCVKP